MHNGHADQPAAQRRLTRHHLRLDRRLWLLLRCAGVAARRRVRNALEREKLDGERRRVGGGEQLGEGFGGLGHGA